DGRAVLVGNSRLMAARGIDVGVLAHGADAERAQGATAVYVAVDGGPAGLVIVADAIKRTTAEALQALQDAHVRVIMLTGDDRRTADAVGRSLGVDEIFADVLPQDKAAIVERLQREGHVVAMAGDGVNDAPALARA